jgi:DNA-binding Lrp family transcriptional regulator
MRTDLADDGFERALVAEIQAGLPLVAQPYAEVAARLGVDEARVIEALARMRGDGTIKRLGVIVRHRELGYHANAMVVWDIDDDRVDEIGGRFGRAPFVTLCYRRPRRPPAWCYNLFTMIHGRDREHVLRLAAELERSAADEVHQREVLFSRRRFKQRGARYAASRGEIR